MITDVRESNYQASEQDLDASDLAYGFKSDFFRIEINPSLITLVSVGGSTNRFYWMRILLLIIQMNALKIDFKVHPFVFEKFQ